MHVGGFPGASRPFQGPQGASGGERCKMRPEAGQATHHGRGGGVGGWPALRRVCKGE